jgi:hypothetical protein
VPVAVVKMAPYAHIDHTPRLLSVGVSRFVILACGVNGWPPLLGTFDSLNAADVGTWISGLFCPRFGCTEDAGHVIYIYH